MIAPRVVWGFNSPDTVQFEVFGPGVRFYVLFRAPLGQSLTAGTTSHSAALFDPVADVPVMRLEGPVPACAAGARFTVYEYSFVPPSVSTRPMESDSSVRSFAADFEVPCGESGTLITGSFRYRSTRTSPLPFDGNYPIYPLRVVSTLGG